MFAKLALIFLAGGFGTLSRYGLAGAVQRMAGSSFPWGTITVNILGCLIFGVIWSLAGEKFTISPEARTIILVGFMGAFTTFSTFVSDTTQMFTAAQLPAACGNILLQNTVGIGAFLLGSVLGRTV